MPELEALGVAVCGVSVDPVERLERFGLKYKLPFTLLADRGGSVAARYGSLLDLGPVKLARRNTFLIDPQGKIARVYLSVDASENPGEVVADLRKLAVSRAP
jgi:peroxiredoxin Q/BCP